MGWDGLPMFAIYHNPKDYPGRFVVRRWLILPGGDIQPDPEPLAVTFTLEWARLEVPGNCWRLERHDMDDPCIVEVWM